MKILPFNLKPLYMIVNSQSDFIVQVPTMEKY